MSCKIAAVYCESALNDICIEDRRCVYDKSAIFSDHIRRRHSKQIWQTLRFKCNCYHASTEGTSILSKIIQITFNQGKPYNKKLLNNPSLAKIVSFNRKTNPSRSSRHRSESPPELHLHTQNRQTPVAGSTPSKSSAVSSFRAYFCKVCYGPGYLTP